VTARDTSGSLSRDTSGSLSRATSGSLSRARRREEHRSAGKPRAIEPLDAEALLVALTLSPATYSRNRFYEMYTSPDVQRTRRRASQLRSVVSALVSEANAKGAGTLVSLDATEDGGAVIVYDVTSLGMRRTVRLRSIELSLLRYCVGRVRGEGAPADLATRSVDGDRIGLALHRLAPLPAPPPSNETT
jgi:hypothetical protein